MPLRVRLTLLFVLGTSLVLAAAGALFYVLLKTNLRDAVDTNLRTRADALVTGLAGASDPAAELRVAAGGPAQLLRPDASVVATTSDAGPPSLLDRAQLAAALARPTLLTLDLDVEHGDDEVDDFRALALTVRVPGESSPAVLVVATPTKIVDDAEDRVRDIMVAASAPMVVLSGLAAWLLSGAALRPVDRMRRQAASIGASDGAGLDSAAVLEVPATRDEIAALAATMNDLLRRLHAARARDRAFVADAGHELRTPLTNLKAELELAGRPGRTRDELAEAVASAADETDRLARLAESLLALARMDASSATFRPVPIGDLLGRAARSAAGNAETHDVTIRPELDLDRSVTVDGDPDMIRQAVDNLLANAVRHAPPASTVELRAHVLPSGVDGAGTTVLVQVRDHGTGFPAEFLPLAFERFTRSDAARTRDRGGTGLGLAIVAATIQAHRGSVTAANHPDGGAVVTLVLPCRGTPTEAA